MRWVVPIHGAGGELVAPNDLAVTGGDTIVVGAFSGTLSIGGLQLTSAGETDIFVVRIAGTGEVEWARRFGGTGLDDGKFVGVGQSGEVVVAGVSQSPTASISSTELGPPDASGFPARPWPAAETSTR